MARANRKPNRHKKNSVNPMSPMNRFGSEGYPLPDGFTMAWKIRRAWGFEQVWVVTWTIWRFSAIEDASIWAKPNDDDYIIGASFHTKEARGRALENIRSTGDGMKNTECEVPSGGFLPCGKVFPADVNKIVTETLAKDPLMIDAIERAGRRGWPS